MMSLPRSWHTAGILVLISLAAVSCSRVKDEAVRTWSPPSFCRNMDCPEFQVVQTISDVELRRYQPAKWVTTNITDKPWGDAVTQGYKLLDDYRSGNNKDKKKVAETVPYFTLFYPVEGQDRQVKSYYTIEYFVPYELQDAPPTPTSDAINWIHVPAQDVWVQAFGGFAAEQDIINRAWDLSVQLKQQGRDLYEEFFGFAQYDPLTTLINRHNEIWLFSKEKPTSV